MKNVYSKKFVRDRSKVYYYGYPNCYTNLRTSHSPHRASKDDQIFKNSQSSKDTSYFLNLSGCQSYLSNIATCTCQGEKHRSGESAEMSLHERSLHLLQIPTESNRSYKCIERR